MAIVDLNNNNYDPQRQDIIDKKAQLKSDLKSGVIQYKVYSEECTKMKRGFEGMSLVGEPPNRFSNKTLENSVLRQQNPETVVFPDGIVNCTLVKWNLDNCVVPPGITMVDCSNKQYKIQNDGEYWEVDKNEKAVKPLSEPTFDDLGLSKDPKDIPAQPIDTPLTSTAREEKLKTDRENRIKEIAADPAKLQAILDSGETI